MLPCHSSDLGGKPSRSRVGRDRDKRSGLVLPARPRDLGATEMTRMERRGATVAIRRPTLTQRLSVDLDNSLRRRRTGHATHSTLAGEAIRLPWFSPQHSNFWAGPAWPVSQPACSSVFLPTHLTDYRPRVRVCPTLCVRPRKHFNLHFGLPEMSPVAAKRSRPKPPPPRRLPPNRRRELWVRTRRELEPLLCAGFRPSGLGTQCLCRGRHWPAPSQLCGSDFGTTAGRSLRFYADEDGPATPPPTGSLSRPIVGTLLESFFGDNLAPVTRI